ncbi:MAG: nucleotidyltransferase family protein [Armatimonadetes bacterium]|nr:nucleotidyltransferase family protein [Armatimonadota bacterium]MDW8120875.1 nucleotidyltransferase family protein [Armatimonadota bacterium]
MRRRPKKLFSVAAVLLAAGKGIRMGEDKLLLPIGDRSLIEETVSLFVNAGVDPVIVVVRSEDERMKALLQPLGVTVAENPFSDSEMLDSVKIGVKKLPLQECRAFLIHPGDQPLVEPATVRRLIRTFFRQTEKTMAVPSYKGRLGHPVLFDKSLYDEIVNLESDSGLRPLIYGRNDRLLTVPVQDPGVVMDIDSWDDYRRALQVWAARHLTGARR